MEGYMQISIDNYGRIIIPKIIREHLGLHAGSVLNIEESNRKIVLETTNQQSFLKIEEGVFVFTGKAIGDMDDVLETIRAERLKKLGDF
jgi:AbrB family looped-hinge helix DNA binding protein